MADDVVGEVRVDVHGNTEPLKDDIRRAAGDVRKTIDTEVADSSSTGITDSIVGQVTDAEKPAGNEAKKTGRAIVKGVAIGIDGDDSLKTSLGKKVRDAQPELEKETRRAARVVNDIITDETGQIQIGPDLSKTASSFRGFWQRIMPGEADGQESGRRVGSGIKKSMLQAGVEKAFLGIATKAATIGPLIAFGVRAAAPLIVGLTGEIAVLGTALGGLGAVGAASMATMLPGIGALKIAFAGLDAEAKKALQAKFTGAMGDLAGFKERVRNEIVPSLVEALGTVSKLAPEINKLGKEAAQAGGNIAKAFANMLVGRKEEIGNIFGNSSAIMERFGKIGVRAVDVLINALDALQPLVMRTLGVVERGMNNLMDTLNKGIDSGAFIRRMEVWYARGKTLLDIFKNLGIVVGNFFSAAADSSDGFLTSFDNLTKKWADWAGSIEGEQTFQHIFDEAVPVLEQVWGLLGDIAGLFTKSFTGDSSGLVDFVKSIREDVIPGIERFQTMLRESGIQDSLYDMADAILKLFESGGGTSIKVFLDTLTVIVGVVSDLLKVLGPVLVPLGTFMGMFKAMQVAKTAFGGLLSLPSMFTNLAGPAKTATGAVEGAAGAIAEAGAVADGDGGKKRGGSAAGKLGKFKGALAGLGGAFNIAAGGYLAFSSIPKMFAEDLPDSTERIKDWTGALGAGIGAMESMTKARIDPGFMNNMNLTGQSLTALEEITRDLDTGWSASFNRWGADTLGVDVAGIDQSRAAVSDMFGAIEQYAATTGDVKGAQQALDEWTKSLEKNGIASEEWQGQADGVAETIADITVAAGGAFKGGGVNILGDFTTEKSALASLGQSFDTQITGKLDAIRKSNRYKDPLTGGLNPAGIEKVIGVYKKANLDMINGLDNAISAEDANRIRAILDDKSAFDQYGNWTKETMAEIAGILPQALKDNADKVKERFDDLKKLMGSMNAEKVGTKAIKLYVPKSERGRVDDEIQAIMGDEVIRLRTEWKDQGKTEDEIDKLLAARSLSIYVDAVTYDAWTELTNLIGADWQAQIAAEMPHAQYIDVEGQLLQLTKGPKGEDKWEAVIGTEADTIRANNAIRKVVKGPNGEWMSTIETELEPQSKKDTEKELAHLARTRDAFINAKTKYLYYDPKTGEYTTGGDLPTKGDKPKGTTSMIVPPSSEGELVSQPSMISPGGPTTMGFADSFGPSARTRANLATGSGVVGSPNYYGKDKDKQPANVTINNYYPKPERVSDTIAMQMRVAKYA